jgi:hypothetical protein
MTMLENEMMQTDRLNKMSGKRRAETYKERNTSIRRRSRSRSTTTSNNIPRKQRECVVPSPHRTNNFLPAIGFAAPTRPASC